MNFKQKFFGEFKAYWVNVLYITLFFTIFTNYRRLILAHYQIIYEEYGVSLIKALVLAKIILVAEHFRLGRGLRISLWRIRRFINHFYLLYALSFVNVIDYDPRFSESKRINRRD